MNHSLLLNITLISFSEIQEVRLNAAEIIQVIEKKF